MEALGFRLRSETTLETMTLEVLKSSEIEGERLDVAQVRSSIARKLGMDIAGLVPSDRAVDGVVEMLLDATQRFDKPLTKDRLFGWHSALFPSGRSGMHRITVGHWRKNEGGPMQVVSGAMGKEKVHFEAPPSEEVRREMKQFLKWLNGPDPTDPVIRSAVAHLWFLTIHPFDDGNGRIARAISDMLLSRSDQSRQRFYSLSAQIRLERNDYYLMLEKSQKCPLDITAWITWYLRCLDRTLDASYSNVKGLLAKVKFRDRHAETPFNARQRKMINRLFDGFKDNLTTTRWARMTKCSQDTALRDIQDLLVRRVLKKGEGGGRSTAYVLAPRLR
jgi:Fic family protein